MNRFRRLPSPAAGSVSFRWAHRCCQLALLCLCSAPLLAQDEPIAIGTVAGQLGPSASDSYASFTRYLDSEIPEYDFTVIPYANIEDMIAAVDQDRLEFALITPVAFIQLNSRHELRPIATVTQSTGTGSDFYPWLAGSVFVRDARTDIVRMEEVRGKNVIALSPLALGGWLSAVREWRALGIDEERDLGAVNFVFSYEQVVSEVCNGTADVGVIAASTFITMRENCPQPLRVLPVQPEYVNARYPLPVSTRLYPEVAVAVVDDVDERLVNQMTQSLLRLEAGSEAALAINVAGFTAPLSYNAVTELMQELRVPPFENFGEFTFTQIWRQHSGKLLLAFTAFMSFLAFAAIRTQILNMRLKQSELFRQQIFDRSQFPVAVLDPSTMTYVDVNPAAVEIYGFRNRSEIIGKGPLLVSAPYQYDGRETIESLKLLDAKIRNSGVPIVFDWLHKRPDGSLWDAEIHIIPFNSGNRDLMQVTLVDITERKRIREEREKMEHQLRHSQRLESIGRLSGAIAHDFNNLLTVINGYSELLLLTTDKNDRNRDTYMQITQACWRARELTYQLLTFSRRQITRMAPIDINQIVLDSASMFRTLLGEKIKLTTSLHTGIGLTLADSGQIHQVLMNFVVNAKDAMPDGGQFSITTGISWLSATEAVGLGVSSGEYIRIAVSDTGIGMTKDIQDKVFEPFFTTKGEKGNGFGLATAYGIIRQCRGAIDFKSEVNIGTTFTVYLPTTDAHGEVAPLPEHTAPLEASGPRTILVVEDQPDVRMYACSVLQTAGYHVLEAESGDKALQIARNYVDRIDLLFTDVVLGGMNGRELAEEFQQGFPSTKFLFTSGYANDEVALYGVIQDRIAFISKPYSPHDLLAKVKVVLEQVVVE